MHDREIDRLLGLAGWAVQSVDAVNLHAARGVAVREFPLEPGHGFADYLLYVEGKAAGVVEAKKQGATLTGGAVGALCARAAGASLPAWRRPLPFVYESTGVETHFSHGLDPAPRARSVFALHRPERLAEWLALTQPPAGTVQEASPCTRTPPSWPARSTCPSSSPNGATSSSGPRRS